MALPKGYKRLWFIQSSGTQYVDTLFNPTQNTRLVLSVAFLGSAGTNVAGVRNGPNDTTNRFGIISFGSASKLGAFFRDSSTQAITFDNNRHLYDLSKSGLVVDGASYGGANSGSFTCTYSLTLFAWSNGAGGVTANSSKIYSCQIYDNDTLVRDYIPCETDAGEVGLWDDVEGNFYGNAGTGTFIKGKYVVREGEYEELEYIQSSGTQYVDTDFIPDQNTRVVANIKYPTTPTTDAAVFGVRNSNAGQFWCYYRPSNSAFSLRIASSSTNNLAAAVPTEKNRIDANKNVLTAGTNSVTATAATFAAEYPMYVFAVNNAGASQYPASVQLSDLQVYDNGLLERDYVPIRYLPTGELGFLDKVYGLFYPNAGSGTFTAGPVVAEKGYTEVEYIRSDGNQYMDTLFHPAGTTKIELDFQMVNQGTEQQGIFGSRPGSTGRFTVFTGTSPERLQVDYNTQFGLANSEVDISGLNVNERTLLSVSNLLLVNGEQINAATAVSFTSAYSLFLFANNNGGSVQLPGALILYTCRITDNGVDIRIYIPKLHPSGVPGLWDEVNQRFYASATTTDLIAGPEKAKAPSAPAGLRVVSETDTSVEFAWNAVEDAAGYRVYQSGSLVADQTETSFTAEIQPFGYYTFEVTAYNENGEGKAATLVVHNRPDNPTLWLVTDRTQDDVAARNNKGTYQTADLNRVGAAVEYLAESLHDHGISVTVSPKLMWTDLEWPTPSTMTTYLNDVRTLRGALKLAESTPEAPEDMEKLTHIEANEIEMILVALDLHIRNMISIVDAGWTAGLAYTGFYAKEAY